ncbi:hypothetical protein ACFWS1_34670, partial [Streptomyces sp. NPDC058612]
LLRRRRQMPRVPHQIAHTQLNDPEPKPFLINKISNLKNGHRAIKPRDVRDLCALYQVTDPHVDCRSSSSGHAEVGQRGRPARSSASWPDIATVS